jgi:hypothetical protein
MSEAVDWSGIAPRLHHKSFRSPSGLSCVSYLTP